MLHLLNKMAVDFTWLAQGMPLFGFFLVFFIMYAILAKSKILGEGIINIFVSAIFAIVFITFSPGIEYVQVILPWFSILIIALFLLLVIVGLSQKDMDKFMVPWLAWIFIIFLTIIIIFAGVVVFSPVLLPGQSDSGGNSFLISVKNFIYGEKFLGAALLLILAAVTSWILLKKK